MQEEEMLAADLEPLLMGAGLRLVELAISRHRGSAQVRAVIFAPAGTGISECSTAHRLIYPRLQILLGAAEPSLEVTSPGIERAIKSPKEWMIFRGKGVRILPVGGGEWTRGRIVTASSGSVTLETSAGEQVFAFADIAKARLDSSQGGD
ncbi:MAG TPA: hypothetical protein VMC79_11225 [Rectinemataceae bacterium]|nr:hypothetical protein [Rectinemataceae bacterium]